jgi:hypothetical protein
MAVMPHYDVMEELGLNATEDYWDDLPRPTSRLRTILGRAAVVYLGLFLGISLLLSMVGVDPLTGSGVIPLGLLVYMGVIVLLALANGDDDSLVEERVRSRLALFAHWPRHGGAISRKSQFD